MRCYVVEWDSSNPKSCCAADWAITSFQASVAVLNLTVIITLVLKCPVFEG